MEFVIFSDGKGFYSKDGLWVDDTSDAARYSLDVDVNKECGTRECRLLNADLFTNKDVDEVIDCFIAELDQEPYGSTVGFVACNILGQAVNYNEDSDWIIDGENYCWDELASRLRTELSGSNRQNLASEYNAYCESQVYLDHNEGFIHQKTH